MTDPKHNGAPRAILLIALLIAGRAFGAQAERKPFVVDNFEASAELEMDYFRYETRARRGARTVIERSVFGQLLRLGIGGYSFDPRLLRYRFHVDLGNDFIWGRFDTPFESDIPRRVSTRGLRINYDLLVQLFPYSRESLSLWTRRRDYLVKDLLFDTFSIEEEVYGARFDTRWPLFPFSLAVETRDLIERGLFEDSRERSDSVRFEMRKEFSERSRLDIDYEYLRRRRVTTGEYRSPQRLVLEESTHRADLYHQYRFGSLLRSNVSSWLSYLDQHGTFPFSNLLGRERLNLFHRPTLQSDYAMTYQESEIGGHKIKAGEMEAGLRHRLFENLITRLEARFRHSDEGQFTWDELELLGSWNYWRHTPWGRLLINYLVQNTARTSDNIAYENNVLYNFF
ncbi:hypothetical protein FJY63_14325, partial [Candidatus Sumerlaeota bacterium]|nr:hypothetical protein [Candidatus Sumerlaeota bacterium]